MKPLTNGRVSFIATQNTPLLMSLSFYKCLDEQYDNSFCQTKPSRNLNTNRLWLGYV
ncbi:hypothetical protein [Capnocytophaga cynodegmi]|uniref:hypothetical protein n=1 Tax=Capnocytophaga cynodegmi TaxID=28189 RepID=UPI0012FFCF48|nr:hypothetical protein [Capnocytophaga cynodegmi]